jgi:DNA segregation ATPase FtsK/SpoIIIE-like protein
MTILGQVGAERLAERGDMLFSYGSRLERLQGFLVTARDAEAAGVRWR